jgi:tRNA(Met) C34 N-acetyltransferase TmcA
MSLAVNPENRGQGYGNTLLDWVEAEAESLGTEVLTLRVDPDNIPAVSQYLKRGFAVVGVRQGIKDYPNVVTLAMTKNLKSPIAHSGEPTLISNTDYDKIDSMVNAGYRGVSMQNQDDNRLLEMVSPDKASAEFYPHWR